MTVTINPFWVGVISTVVVEAVLFFIWVVSTYLRTNRASTKK